MRFNPFVLPFLAGTIIFFTIIIFKFYSWIHKLDKKQKYFIKKNLFTTKTLSALSEIFKEALVHRKIYKKNPLLGYMHMSLAFGWFLLIVIGKAESMVYNKTPFGEPWGGIFFRYFVTDPHSFSMQATFSFVLDFLLLIILSGVALALIKRFRSRLLGIKKTTNHRLFDKIAIMSLWWIFPFRLLAESTTAAIHHNGSFLTNSVGSILSYLPAGAMELPLWWAYSVSLFFFFICIPFSRYMHIPTEVVLILLRKYGVGAGEEYSGYSDIQINSCSRCGICIDSCQLDFTSNFNNVQSVYFIRDIRYNKLSDDVVNNCLMCGRCVEDCPVGLELTLIRQQHRNKHEIVGKHYFDYAIKEENHDDVDVVFFAGCMSHLTPGTIIAMKKIFNKAGEKFWFMDENKGLCCGRPMRQQGFVQQSKDLISKNSRMIADSKAKLLVTPCPICYKSFKEEYTLNIPVMHHSEYIEHLVKNNKLKLNKTDLSVVYHDPCELGRGTNVYEQPRNLLRKVSNLKASDFERENSLCCGSSLANTVIELDVQIKIRNHALSELTKLKPDILATACPLCKKSFVHGNKAKVMDLAEIIAENIENDSTADLKFQKNSVNELVL